MPMLEERDFQKKCEAALEELKRRLLHAGDEHGFDVEGESGKLEVVFEEPAPAKFVVSPRHSFCHLVCGPYTPPMSSEASS